MSRGNNAPLLIKRKEAGQSLLEVALMITVLLTMVIGIIEFGRYAYIGILVGNAARAGAAFAVQNPGTVGDTTDITTAAKNDFQSNGQPANSLSVNSSYACGCDNGGTLVATLAQCTATGAGVCPSGQFWVITVTVEASGTFNSLFSFPGIPASLTLDRTCTMRANSL